MMHAHKAKLVLPSVISWVDHTKMHTCVKADEAKLVLPSVISWVDHKESEICVKAEGNKTPEEVCMLTAALFCMLYFMHHQCWCML